MIALVIAGVLSSWEGATAIQMGDLPFGTYDGGGLGAALDGGHRWDRLFAFGEAGFVSEDGKIAGSTDSTRGYLGRVSANARYDVLRDSLAESVQIDLTVQGGLGEEYLRYAQGGSIRRGDVSLGFAGDMRVGRPDHYWGFSAGLELLFARSPEATDATVRCAGPCYVPSSPIRWDLGALYVIGFQFGR